MQHSPILPSRDPLSVLAELLPPDMGLAPLLALAESLRTFKREQLATTVEVLIAFMDSAEGDADEEDDDRGGESVALVDDPEAGLVSDESFDPDEDGQHTEDEISTCLYTQWADGAGCPISDPGGAGEREDDESDGTDQGDCAWIEWQTRGRHKLALGDHERTGGHEDAEEDDAPEEDDDSGQCTEDEISCGWPGFGDRGPGCSISDPDYCDVERGDKTTYEAFGQGCGSAEHYDDDDEPRYVPISMDGMPGFTARVVG